MSANKSIWSKNIGRDVSLRYNKRALIIVGCIVLICIIWTIRGVLGPTPMPEKIPRPEMKPSPEPTVQEAKIILPSYSILDEEVYEVPGKTQVILKMLVSGQISETGLRLLLNSTYISVKSRRGFKYHDSPTVIGIYAFTSEEKANSGSAQWIAMLTKGPHDGPVVNISKEDLSLYQSPPKPEKKFGLSETKRKQIFQEYVKAEDRAMMQAEKKYPLGGSGYPVGEYPSDSELREIMKKNQELMRRLEEKYKNQIVANYTLTKEQLEQIAFEGGWKHWAMPKWIDESKNVDNVDKGLIDKLIEGSQSK